MKQSLRLVTAIAIAAAAGMAVPFPGRDIADDGAGTAQTSAPTIHTGSLALAQAAPSAPDEASAAAPESAEAIRLSFAPIVKRVAPAVVNVYATSRVEVRSPFEGDPFFERFFGGDLFGDPFSAPRERVRNSLGSGVIVDGQGIVVTNNHVVGDASDVKVALADGREFQAAILIRDERTDLAVLRIENGDETFPALPFGDSDDLEVGDLVLAVGNPFAVGQTVTSGIVSALARTNLSITDSGFFIQTDAAINPGNSGGALVDMDGAVVGINTAIFSRTGGSIGIGFAIPSNMVRVIVAQALAGSASVARPWIGVSCQEVTADIAASLGISAPHGALVRQVDAGSPGETAGLQVGDLIMRAGGRDIADPAGLDYRLAVAGIGSSLDLEVWRNGETIALSVVAEAEPQLDEGDFMLLGGRSPLTGAVVADLSAALADRLRIRETERGAVIVDVEPLSPAARMGFQAGDVVMQAQGEEVASAEQLAGLVEADDRIWRITFSRGGRISNLVIGG
jgi:Do/DeqQ family serine protease